MREKVSIGRLLPLGLQHVFAMFGATVFVPLTTGLNPSVALFTSAIGTLLFHLITGGKVPAYLGSSFAFIAPIMAAKSEYGISAALGGCIAAGIIYIIVGYIIKVVGTEVIHKLVPPVVIGPMIMVIGLKLAGTAKIFSEVHYLTAFFTLAVVIIVSMYAKGIVKVLPVLIGIVAGYIFAYIMYRTGVAPQLFDFKDLAAASWAPALPEFVSPTFNINAILIVAPVALVTMIEHLGDMMAISRTVDHDFIEDPGIHRTLWGDGIATAFAGLIGGPPNTTYGENVGVLALTKIYNPIVVEAAAIIVLILSLLPKFGEFIRTIPKPVMGGIMIMVFGMIASVGLRTLIEKQVDLMKTRNLIIVSVVLVIGLSEIKVLSLDGMGLAALVGILLNLVLPKEDKDKKTKSGLDYVAD
ncbi:uracil permease [Clostridium sp. 'deep sea']|uniref:uracil-xanthine permease family protein n=1 Tax=Clostridium sp. 'deep sea' TaxID=2779445 RepID=UPI0018964F53|nr:solute carrier family 23 protein [Clostridium sp. 'deep sea']QOR36200.1 uracil permease [Clostridium sp. 'deep sea']